MACANRKYCRKEQHDSTYPTATFWPDDRPRQSGNNLTSAPYLLPRRDLVGKTQAQIISKMQDMGWNDTQNTWHNALFLWAFVNGAKYARPATFDDTAAQDARDRLHYARVATSTLNFKSPASRCTTVWNDMLGSAKQPGVKIYAYSPCDESTHSDHQSVTRSMPRWGTFPNDRYGAMVVPPNSIVNLYRDHESCSLPCTDNGHYYVYGLSGFVRDTRGATVRYSTRMVPLVPFVSAAGRAHTPNASRYAFPDSGKAPYVYQASQIVDWDTYKFLCCTGDRAVGAEECGDLWPGATGDSKVLGAPSKCQGVFLKVCQSGNTALVNSRCLSVCQAAQSIAEVGLTDLSDKCDAMFTAKCKAVKGKGTAYKPCACMNSTVADALVKSSEGLVPRHCADPIACTGAGVYLKREEHTTCKICANIATTNASSGAKVAARQALNCNGVDGAGDTGGGNNDGGDAAQTAKAKAAAKSRMQHQMMLGGGFLVLLLIVLYLMIR